MRTLFLAVLLSGCATTSGGLAGGPADMTIPSEKPPEAVFNCLAQMLSGGTQTLRLSETHFVLTRVSPIGLPLARWDILGTETGSRIELRSDLGVGTGDDDARTCAA